MSNKMKPNRNKIEGALAEIRSSRSNVKHLIADAFGNELDNLKKHTLDKLNTMFEGLEEYLIILANADLAAHD